MVRTTSPRGTRQFLPPLTARWRRLSLAGQFALAGSVVLLAGMGVIGVWVSHRVEVGVMRNAATSTALYMDSIIEPMLQELSVGVTISPPTELELDQLLESSLGRGIVSFNVWKEDGLVVYSSRKSIVGQTFATKPTFDRAWAGEVTAEFEDDNTATGYLAGRPLLEMYSPIRENRTGRIIAVAEFYQEADPLLSDLFWVNLTSWLVVGTVTASMLGLLSGIVLRGSRTIDSQRQTLELRVVELSRLLAQNVELRNRVQLASRRTTEINEQYLRRIGADLHDGPAQLLALAALRFDSLNPPSAHLSLGNDGRSSIDVVRESLTDALADIRAICTGLTLPELDELSPARLLENAAKAHERRTDTKVELEIFSTPDNLEKSMKICLYRFAQEALSNAFRHAGGVGQRLTCRYENETLEVEVIDTGPGFDPSDKSSTAHGLGLRGLRERIESLGGSLQVISAPGQGTRLVLSCGVKA